MRKLLFFFLITCFCHAQTGRVYYHQIKPVPQTAKVGDNNYITRFIHNSLQVEEGYTEHNNPAYKITMGGKVLKDWFSEDNSGGGGDAGIYIYYSLEAKDYYVFIWSGFEDSDWIDAFHVTALKAEYKGQYGYDNGNPDYYYFKTGNPAHEAIEKGDFEEVYIQNENLHIANFIGGDYNRVITYNDYSTTKYVMLKDTSILTALEKKRKPYDGVITLELNLNSDDIPEKYGIDFKNKKITYLNNAAKDLNKIYEKNQEHPFNFKQDTLIIADYFVEHRPDPTTAFSYEDYYYFVASPYDNNPILVKRIASREVDKYQEPYGPYKHTYFTDKGVRLSQLPKFISTDFYDYHYREYRPLNLSDVENQLKNKSDYYVIQEMPPSAFEIYKLLQKEPLTTKNVTRYNDVAYYLEQLIQNHILKLENAKGTKQYFTALSSAQYLLEKILEQFPNRSVAHLNLADILWNNYDKSPAKKYYKSYIELMKKDGKEAKIPARVHERVK